MIEKFNEGPEEIIVKRQQWFIKIGSLNEHIKSSLIIGGSIILGSILISSAVWFGLAKVSGKTVYSTGTTSQQAINAPAPAQNLPPSPVTIQDRKNQPTMGKSSAKITIYEFSDFQCPYCKQFFEQTSEQLKKEYVDSGKIQFVYRHFPLSFHVNAEISAVAAECANDQGKFWEYHDILFKEGNSDGKGLDIDSLKAYANRLGLNGGTFGFGKNKFNNCLDNKSTLSIVKDDNNLGNQYGISGTPSFVLVKDGQNTIDLNVITQAMQNRQNIITFANGNAMLVGAQPYSVFKAQLDRMLQN